MKQKLSQEALGLLFSCRIGFISLSRKVSGSRMASNEKDFDLELESKGSENLSHLNEGEKDSTDHSSGVEVDQGTLKECQTLCDLTHQRLQAICKSALKLFYSSSSGGAKSG